MNPRRLYLISFLVLSMLFLALLPNSYFWFVSEGDWRPPYVTTKGDESLYAAYVNALMDGRPRRNDPFTGHDDRVEAPQPESIYSVQFIPPYAIALTGRALGLSASTSFTLLRCVAAVAAALVLFWLLLSVTGNDLLAATGVMVVLCLGTLFPWRPFFDANEPVFALPFLRRYVPAFPFPFYLGFCLVVWHMLVKSRTRQAMGIAVIAASIFAILVFSYFFLWTAAAAWLACLALLWLIVRPEGWPSALKLIAVVGGLSLIPLFVCFQMLTKRPVDAAIRFEMELTHRPMLLQKAEVLALIVIALMVWAYRKGRINLKSSATLFIASFALMPFVVFNQQVITGRLLQPYHYSLFAANYSVLIALVLAAWSIGARERPKYFYKFFVGAAILAFAWGSFETIWRLQRNSEEYRTANDAYVVALKLSALGHNATDQKLDTQSIVFATDPWVAECLLTGAPQPVLWGYHMPAFSGSSPTEYRERFLQYLYYTGSDPVAIYDQRAGTDLRKKYIRRFLLALLQYEHILRGGEKQPSEADHRALLKEYSDYITAFDRRQAAGTLLSYLVTSPAEDARLSNLDRWYERDSGEPVGRFILYRLRLKP